MQEEVEDKDMSKVMSTSIGTVKPRQNGRKITSFRGATAKLGAGVDNELGGSAPHQCRYADVVWTARCRDGVMSCCWLWLFCAYQSFLVDGLLGCWPRWVSPSGLQRTGRRAELLGVKSL